MSEMKLCKRCNQHLPATPEYWRKDNSTKDGFSFYCKACRRSENRAYMRNNRDKLRGWVANYREAHADFIKMRAEILKMKRSGAFKPQYQAQGGKCGYCGCDLRGVYEIDHILPLTRGGTNEVANLMVCCEKCNYEKSRLTLDEWTPPLQRSK